MCAEAFPRLRLPGRLAGEAESLPTGPFALGVLLSAMCAGVGVFLLIAVRSGDVGADYWWTRGLYHMRFRADVLAAVAVTAVHAIGLLIHLHMTGAPTPRDSHHRAALVLIAQGCAAAACLSADLIALIFMVQSAVVALWLLARLDDSGAANRMLATVYAPGMLLILAALLMWQLAGDTSISALPFLMVAVPGPALRTIAAAIVLGLLPLVLGPPAHGWLLGLSARAPLAGYSSAVLLPLIGGATMLRLLPGSIALASAPVLAPLGFTLGVLALGWGAVRALLARELRHLAAWLSVTQAGCLLIALAAAASARATGELVAAAALQVIVAPAAIAAMWSAAGAVRVAVGTDALAGLSGLVGRTPVAGAALLLGGASLAGIPLLPGSAMQRLLLPALLHSGHGWAVVVVLLADAAIVVAVLNAFRLAFLRGGPPPGMQRLSPALSIQVGLVTLALVGLGLAHGPLTKWCDEAVRTVLSAAGSSTP
jgi:formate hydrogenlyase subunit 3/multisubunit Na+/H+ antiporter MnhD subunit